MSAEYIFAETTGFPFQNRCLRNTPGMISSDQVVICLARFAQSFGVRDELGQRRVAERLVEQLEDEGCDPKAFRSVEAVIDAATTLVLRWIKDVATVSAPAELADLRYALISSQIDSARVLCSQDLHADEQQAVVTALRVSLPSVPTPQDAPLSMPVQSLRPRRLLGRMQEQGSQVGTHHGSLQAQPVLVETRR